MDEYFVEEKSAGDKLLDLLVFLAVFLVTIFLILEILGLFFVSTGEEQR